MADTSIEWTDKTWNPVTGCTKVSPGCKHCYAEGIADRFFAKQYPSNADGSPRRFTDVRTHEDRLDAPLHWRKPQRIFVNSMSDLFHEAVPDSFINSVFRVMIEAKQHTFQVLTKRADRMAAYCGNRWGVFGGKEYPLADNIWCGVSVEDQQRADERIPLLLQTPAAVRFLSVEPLLGPIQFRDVPGLNKLPSIHVAEGRPPTGIDWVIVGGESGPGARPMQKEWATSIRDQCQATGVPFFFKQWGGVNKKATGDLLDGRQWHEFPKTAEAQR